MTHAAASRSNAWQSATLLLVIAAHEWLGWSLAHFSPHRQRTPTHARTDPLERKAPMVFEATRYDRAWLSEGNLTEVVARRSMVAGVLLAAMGALIKPCTERSSRNTIGLA